MLFIDISSADSLSAIVESLTQSIYNSIFTHRLLIKTTMSRTDYQNLNLSGRLGAND